jgi:hypothetical protein
VDEALQLSRHLLDALDHVCKDVESDPVKQLLPFGGKSILMAGDVGQTLPMMPGAARSDVIAHLLSNAATWGEFTPFKLHENMRILTAGSSLGANALRKCHRFLMKLRTGEFPVVNGTQTLVQIPPEFGIVKVIKGITEEELAADVGRLIQDVHPGFTARCAARDHSWMAERTILVGTNVQREELNNTLLSLVPGEKHVLESADSVCRSDLRDAAKFRIGVKDLNVCDGPALPPHLLRVKVGCPLIITKNIDRKAGLVNGTKVVLLRMVSRDLMVCKVVSGPSSAVGKTVAIHRVRFWQNAGDTPVNMKWIRVQFPVTLAHALTINKSQGQTLKMVGAWLLRPCFGHGQLYVACSRVGSPEHIVIHVRADVCTGTCLTNNVVYQEAFKGFGCV